MVGVELLKFYRGGVLSRWSFGLEIWAVTGERAQPRRLGVVNGRAEPFLTSGGKAEASAAHQWRQIPPTLCRVESQFLANRVSKVTLGYHRLYVVWSLNFSLPPSDVHADHTLFVPLILLILMSAVESN